MSRDFEPIASSLREQVTEFYERRGESLTSPAGVNTLETNSGLVERRGRMLLSMLDAQSDAPPMAGARVIDVGCGFGALAALFAAEGASVTGIDVDDERFVVGEAVARKHRLDMRFARAHMEALDALAHAQFDIAVVNNSLCYLTAPRLRQRALREILRVLRPGGWVILRNPNRLSVVDPFTGLPVVAMLPPHVASRVAHRLGVRRSDVQLTSAATACRELTDAGFVAVREAHKPGATAAGVLHRFTRYHHVMGRRPHG
jgi:2-polyprenyl-3-methyl-5-hydroxy-6-metoxy-1,4-benzoquinol methylase